MRELLIVAQSADPLSGGAGWVGAGLLGLVLGWLLVVYLPSQDKRHERIVAAHEKELADTVAHQRKDFLDLMNTARQDFKATIERVMLQHQQDIGHLVNAIDKDAELTRQLITETRQRNKRGVNT